MRLRLHPAALLAALLVATSCVVAPATPTAPPNDAPLRGRIVVPVTTELVLNPVLNLSSVETDVAGVIYDSLVRFDPSARPVPRLAERWEHSPDGRTLRFRLRDGLRWSDGSALTGADFVFTLESILRSRNPNPTRLSSVREIEGATEFKDGRASSIRGIQVHDRDITITLSRPLCSALERLGALSVVPRAVFSKYLDARDPSKNSDGAIENALPHVASGPFRVRERIPGARIILAANDLFHGGRPPLDEIEVRVIPSASETLDKVLSGEVHAYAAVGLGRAERDELRRGGHLSVVTFLGSRYTYIGWNQQGPAGEIFRSKTVRQALAYGLNVDTVLNKVLADDAVRVLAHTHPLSWAYDPAGLNPYRYDPKRAQELLESEGWSKGADGIYQRAGRRLSFRLTTFAAPDNLGLQREAVQQYRQIGIDVSPETVGADLSGILARLSDPQLEGGIDAWIARWVLSPDPDAYGVWHSSGANLAGYRSAVVDRAVEDGRAKCAVAERTAAYRVMDRQLNEDQPYLFAFAPNSHLVHDRRLKGIEPNPFAQLLWNVEKWRWAP